MSILGSIAIIFVTIVLLLIWGRKIPVFSIPIGFVFITQFGWLIGEDYFHGTDNSVGSSFVPFILFLSFLLALFGLFLFANGIERLTSKARRIILLTLPSITCFIVFIVFIWWSQSNIGHVLQSAKNISGNKPYCIDVASGNTYKEATSADDFSGYQMRSPHGWGSYSGPHAVLAVGTGSQLASYHWSYGQKTFIKDSNRFVIYCSPRQHFVESMQENPLQQQTNEKFRYAGLSFSIPKHYEAHVTSAYSTPTIVFYAMPPNFESFSPNTDKINKINASIEMSLAETNRPDQWLMKNDSSQQVEENTPQFGLMKHTTWYIRPGSVKVIPSYFEYFHISKNKKVDTLINCSNSIQNSNSIDLNCLHVFKRNGWTYTFHHSSADLPNWNKLQDNLVRLTRSFLETPLISQTN